MPNPQNVLTLENAGLARRGPRASRKGLRSHPFEGSVHLDLAWLRLLGFRQGQYDNAILELGADTILVNIA
jgi:hypothetical protein